MHTVELIPPAGPIQPSPSLPMPLSKSIAARQIVIDALCGQATMETAGEALSEDIRHIWRAVAESQQPGTEQKTINIGASGTAMRLLTAFFAQQAGAEVLLTGVPRMTQRPIAILVYALRALGADIEYAANAGFPPLIIHGKPLSGGQVDINSSVSSQYISALLLIAPLMRQPLTLRLMGDHVASWPYIMLTVNMMRQRGITVYIDGNAINVTPGRYTPTARPIEGDWSAAAFWYSLCAVSGQSLNLEGLTLPSLQGDARVAEIFTRLCVATSYHPREQSIYIRRPQVYAPTDIVRLDLADTPDMVPALAVCLCLLRQSFVISGVASLRIKECDRLCALATELGKLGYSLGAGPDHLRYDGHHTAPTSNDINICTYDDHRIAMAFAPAAWLFPGIRIENPGCVAKSYPDFWRHLAMAGYTLTPGVENL